MKGPKDSKESHTSVTMEGTACAGRAWGGGCSLLSAGALPSGSRQRSPSVFPCAALVLVLVLVGGWDAPREDAGGVQQPPTPCPPPPPSLGAVLRADAAAQPG